MRWLPDAKQLSCSVWEARHRTCNHRPDCGCRRTSSISRRRYCLACRRGRQPRTREEGQGSSRCTELRKLWHQHHPALEEGRCG